MQANVGRSTQPEINLRKALFASGLRFRKDIRPEPDIRCTVDIVFPRRRLCVFVDGCFWHGCPLHFKTPQTNGAWWREKIEETVSRDLRQTKLLERRSWLVLRIWEHELRLDLQSVVARIRASVLNS